ncbi:MAG: hypothetical protein J0G32_06915 [Alphaproteobacteria bacterium]|nr:hypothetical protein [Alphaproteobacteria bacterium]OJV15829.1 MAG: hypothetical protein BGO27_07945 [Alphaproteobacteria bacterium 33-17]
MQDQATLFTSFNISRDVLGIPDKAIKNHIYTAEYWYFLGDEDVDNIMKSILIINKFHSYFHFEQTALYLFKALINKEKSAYYIEKSLFQDHQNKAAIDAKNGKELGIEDILGYPHNIRTDDDFLKFALIDYTPAELLFSHRKLFMQATEFYRNNDIINAEKFIDDAINLIEEKHDLYHKNAAICYLKRAYIFEKHDRIELAKNDRIKANDLYNWLANTI